MEGTTTVTMGLTEVQVELIQQQWRELAKDKKGNGVAIFILLFTEYPEYQDLFGMLKGLSLEELKTSPKMRAHGLTFMHGVQSFVENLNDTDTLVQLLRKNAERHASRGQSMDSFHNVWGLFPKVLELKLGDSYNDKAKEAWGAALAFMQQVTDEALTSLEAAKQEAGALTEAQVAIIKDGWDVIAKDKKQNGVDLFIVFFTHYPEYQDLFGMLKGLTIEELKTHHKMRAHGLTFMHGLHAIIDNLEDPDCLAQLVRKNAERHAGRGTTQESFDNLFALLPAFLEQKLGESWNDEAKDAWGAVVQFLAHVTERRIAEHIKEHTIDSETNGKVEK